MRNTNYEPITFNYFCVFSEISPSRHIACEICDTSVHGGYDPIMNQVRYIINFVFFFLFDIEDRNVQYIRVFPLGRYMPKHSYVKGYHTRSTNARVRAHVRLLYA